MLKVINSSVNINLSGCRHLCINVKWLDERRMNGNMYWPSISLFLTFLAKEDNRKDSIKFMKLLDKKFVLWIQPPSKAAQIF